MTRARTALFWGLAAALVIGHVIVAWHSLFVWRLWEDEAFNLTVPRNLLAGLGYSSDGALSGSTITPFDPRISTGPVVLLPVAAVLATGADLVIGARLVPLTYWVLLLVGLALIGRRIGGRWAALLAVTVPLAFITSAGVSPIQGPADLLGEIPAAALLVWALLALPRRAWVAGLLVGLAVQAKLIALLALPAFAVALLLLADGRGWARVRNTLRRSWLPLLLVAAPTMLFELAALLSLGLGGYVDHLRALVAFVRSGGQGASTTVLQKLQTFADSWSGPAAITVIGLVLLAVIIVTGVVFARRSSTAGDRLVIAYASAAAVGVLTFIGWWATASQLPLWVRHPAVGIYAFLPVLAAVAVWSARRIPRGATARITVAATSVLALLIGIGAAMHVASSYESRGQTLERQRAAVAPLTEWVAETGTEWLAAQPWGAAVPAVVLTGAHVGLFDAPAMLETPRLTGAECATQTLAEGGYRICAAP
ncbi:hypothetical protein KZC51_07110 [Microbacterium sp. SSW1-49]|uniref:DUF2029 domain-containing protein n=1 Tax=Microbacterium croceum TaxID=2851645 RepID=A0ABT0FCV2_9MICO|nr:hypothetical protein [Microbacterium croceum]MCK2035901.1 hypothetical protein [Microbacterium croceum]